MCWAPERGRCARAEESGAAANHFHRTVAPLGDGHRDAADQEAFDSAEAFRADENAMGLPVVTVDASSDITAQLENVYRTPGPVFCNVEIRVDQKLHPVLKSGAPLDDQMPLMPREKLAALRLLKC